MKPWKHGTKSPINEFDFHFIGSNVFDKDIFRLDISMSNALRVGVVESYEYFSDDLRCGFLGKFFLSK